MSAPAADTAPYRADADGVAARARALTKAYESGETTVRALGSVDIAHGRFTVVMGPSGSGKSTLMHCPAGLGTVSAGQVWLGDTEITGLKERELNAAPGTDPDALRARLDKAALDPYPQVQVVTRRTTTTSSTTRSR